MRLTIWTLSTFLLLFSSLAHASVCRPVFPPEQNKPSGWLGADAAYSIPLGDDRSVWIFGDTLYGEKRVVRGNEPRMIHNTLGISTCDDHGVWHIQYVVKRGTAGHPQSYFSPKDINRWYWAMDGFKAHGDLWVLLLCVEAATGKTAGAMNFKICGSDLAQISHIEQDPQNWQVSIHPLVANGVGAYPSATVAIHDDFAYLFALYEAGNRPLIVARVPLSGLNKPKENLQYLALDGSWKGGFKPADAKEIMKQGTSELSIRYHSDRKQWIAVMFDPNGFSDKIILRTASELTGPWSEGTIIYRVPEMSPDHPAQDKNTFCYAAKEHPEFEQKKQLLFTYICNTMDVPSLATNLKIYLPQVVTVPLPVTSSEDR